mmetsp:Transcript_18860/g.32694  ORF Transcript_18860/g.32694 Transcript_18860/m.32694 type:complete len:712 (+) Transcript_18860:71-2206(+)|eukprot:CAMPEP_0184706364 /NCGR_PEP_ID=MMETSP0313-20130426/36721_1 /TAXON_ID=2792 /ORGANISM="Porphyridium aerugineum, Strain SAG 1380-2" /LENGTH=711 /DNA_ID=CAMNT_0027167917 /DNA_START=47 /DNA_END=2182 /DNA_ORIENTATION=+
MSANNWNSLQNVIGSKTLKWIFVGGKGGVGKTSTSCSIAYALAKAGHSTLLISTDPAHNVSDALGEKVTSTPMQIRSVPNLSAMETEIEKVADRINAAQAGSAWSDISTQQRDQLMSILPPEFQNLLNSQQGGAVSLMNQLLDLLPGIDEAMAFAGLMQKVLKMNYSKIVFDTAPTGHTLRLLSFPKLLQQAVAKLKELHSQFAPLFSSINSMIGGGGANNIQEALTAKLEETSVVVDQVIKQFGDESQTTFVAVAIAEFLSVYETERLVQQLEKIGMHVNNIVLNQLLIDAIEQRSEQFKDDEQAKHKALLQLCDARLSIQQKYVSQLLELYGEDFHITQMPILDDEIRGAEKLRLFSSMLLRGGRLEEPEPLAETPFEPNLKNIVEQESLKWIFVGGKGGVGKTTTSCSLSVALHDALASTQGKVLIVSTDPAHNLSDAFGERISVGGTPTQLRSFERLYALEIESSLAASKLLAEIFPAEMFSPDTVEQLASSVPGIDEAIGFAHMLQLVNDMNFAKVVFDTAPTGHTLRLLHFPGLLEKGLLKLEELKTVFEPMAGMLGGMGLGGQDSNGMRQGLDGMSDKIKELKAVVDAVAKQLSDPDRCTFIAVSIAELLSVYETERLVQQLAELDLDIRNVVVNQIMRVTNESEKIPLLKTRAKMQAKYIAQVEELYPSDEYHITRMPLLPVEVRGIQRLGEFSSMLIQGSKI